MRFGGEIHRSTCRYKYQTSPAPFILLLFTFVDLYEDLASLRICCVSWVLYGNQGVGIPRFGMGLGTKE